MEQAIVFVKENFLLLLVVLVALVLIVSLIKSFLRWLLVLVVIAGVFIYGHQYIPDSAKALAHQAVSGGSEQALAKFMTLSTVTYQKGKHDGDYVLTGGDMTLSGNVGNKHATLKVKGVSLDVPVDEVLYRFIQRVKARS